MPHGLPSIQPSLAEARVPALLWVPQYLFVILIRYCQKQLKTWASRYDQE